MKRTPDQDVQELVEVYNTCETFSALPDEGGVLDQDQLLMRKFGMVQEAKAEKQQRDQQSAKQGKGK